MTAQDGPQRVQLRRTRGWRKPEGVVVARPSKWGNPYRIDEYRTDYPGADERELRRMAVSDYRGWLDGRWERTDQAEPPAVERIRAELAGRDLGCWCPLDQPCHADVLIEIANGGAS